MHDVREALTELDEAIDGLIAAIESLPAELRRAAEWGPREVLVHIVFAHELYISYLRATTTGEKPPLFEGRYNDQNARALAENTHTREATLLKRLRDAQAEIGLLVAAPAVKRAPFYFKRGAKRRTLVQALDAIVSHVRGHTRDIRCLARKNARA